MSIVPPPAPNSALAPVAPTEQSPRGRVDGELKATGQILYADDLALAGLLHASVLRSPHAHARIGRVDTTAARQVPGVRCVLTGADVAHIRFGRAVRDTPILAVDKVRFIGEMVVAVAADSRDAAEAALALVEVEYDPLPAVFDAREALQPEAPAVHDAPASYAGAARGPEAPANLMGRAQSRHGDVDAALAASDRVFEHTFTTQPHHQGYLEPHSCTALLAPDGQVHIWSCNKAPYKLREQLAAAFDIPIDQIVAHTPAIGGDFGGKGSPMDIPLCIELSRRANAPVRMTMRYAEELLAAGPRHAAHTTVRVGVTHDGLLQALDVHAVFNGGAYAGFRPSANFQARAATSYRIPTVRVICDRVYTNQVPGGNARSPGAPQLTFAVESMLDHVARQLGLDPASFRRNNLLRDGEASPFGDHWPETRALATLDAAERAYAPAFPADAPRSVRFGRGIAAYDRTTHAAQHTSIRLRLEPDGTLEAQLPQAETGTGSHTILRHVIARGLQLRSEDTLHMRYVGTAHLPYDSGVGGSRVTVSASEAAYIGVQAFRAALATAAARALGVPPDTITLGADAACTHAASGRTLSLADVARAATAAGEAVEAVGEVDAEEQGPEHKEAVTAFCVQIAQVGVDVETGQIFVYRLLTAHDVAEVLDPMTHQSQIEGGVMMGVGYALTEDLGIVDGQTSTAHMGDYKLPCMADLPPLDTVLVTGGRGVGAYNVKAIGETPNVPTAAAIANAVADAIGARVDSLPLTAEKVLQALRERRV